MMSLRKKAIGFGLACFVALGSIAAYIPTGTGWGLTSDALQNVAVSPTNPPNGCGGAISAGLSTSVAGNALTINLTAANGSALSSTNPASVCFHSTTLATGAPVWAPVTAPLSLVVPSGASLGASNAAPFRLWIVAFNSGTDGAPVVALGVLNAASGAPATSGSIFPLSSTNGAASTTAITSGSASAQIFYTSAGLTSKPYVVLGYFDYNSGLTTAGTWNANPTKIQLFGPGVLLPGASVQSIFLNSANASAAITATTLTAMTNTSFPAITPTSPINLVRYSISDSLQVSAVSAVNCIGSVQVARGPTPIGVLQPIASPAISGAVGNNSSSPFINFDAPATVSPTTYSMQGKIAGAGCNVTSVGITGVIEEIMD